MALLALSFQPIAAALFSVRDIYKTLPGSPCDHYFFVFFTHFRISDTSVNNLRALSLNQDEQVQDLTSAFPVRFVDATADCGGGCVGFLGASGLASASIVYGLGDPAFVHDGYTVGTFEVIHVPSGASTSG